MKTRNTIAACWRRQFGACLFAACRKSGDAVLLLAALAVFSAAPSLPAAEPVAPEENLTIIRIVHRDAGEIARMAEDILNRTGAPEERARGILTVDPGLNALVIRAAGPGATWPASVRRIAEALDLPTDSALLKVSVWRLRRSAEGGGKEGPPPQPQALLSEDWSERLDSYQAPVEGGVYLAASLDCEPEDSMRVTGVVGPIGGGGATARLAALRLEAPLEAAPRYSMMGQAAGMAAGPVLAPGGPGMPGVPGMPAAPNAPNYPNAQGMAHAPAAPPAAGPGQGANPQAAQPNVQQPAVAPANQPPVSAGERPAEEMAPSPLFFLPPPQGEVIFAGPLNLDSRAPVIIGPFSVSNWRGRYIVSVELLSSSPSAHK